MKKALLAAFLLLSSISSAWATAGCSVIGGWPGAQYGLQAQLLTDALPCYGITGTKGSPVVLGTAPTLTAPVTITGASAQALSVGRLGVTTPVLMIDSSNASSITGIDIIGQSTGNGVNISAIGEATVPIIMNAAGGGTINFNTSGTGVINLFRNAFINHDSNPTLTLGSVGGTLAHLTSPGTAGTAFTTGGGDQVTILNTASSTRQVTLTGSNGANPTIGTSAGNLALSGHLVLEGVTTTGATGTGNIPFSASPTFTGTPVLAAPSATTLIVGASTTLPASDTVVISTDSTTLPAAGVQLHIGGTSGAQITEDSVASQATIAMRRANTSHASPSALASGDLVFNLTGNGYDGTAYSNAAFAMRSFASPTGANWTNADHGMYATILTTPAGSTTATEAMRIQPSGGVSVGTTTDLGIGTLLANSTIKTLSTTAATSATTGSGIFGGGVGVAGAIWAGTYVDITPTVVNSLPSCVAGIDGARAFVTNNNTAVSFGGAVTTGGTTHSPVYCDGSATAWKQG